MTNRLVGGALAVWMILAAFLGLAATAAPQHLIGGGLLGPGIAPGNPADFADYVFYAVNQPAYPLLVGAGVTPADGTNATLWVKDVGLTWNWAVGDDVVVVAETRRGVNGWTDTNRTSSIDATLQTGATVQDFGDGTLEPLPTLTTVPGTDFVQVSWAALVDGNSNVVSYEVFHAASAAGPWTTAVARVPDGPSPSANHTGLLPGAHCYAVGANYRQDLVGGVYTTVGLSEPVCTSIVDLVPTVLSTNPAHGQPGVAVTAPIVVTFSERMNTSTVGFPISPTLTLTPSWNSPTDTILTLTHATDFTACSLYTVTISGSDMTGNPLGTGPVPNPFDFRAFCPAPFVLSTTPANGVMQVRTDTTIVIRFSESMVTATVTRTIVPSTTVGASWNTPTNDTLTLTPSVRLAGGTLYTVEVTAGEDLDGNGLIPGSWPNPWTFTTNTLPTVDLDPSNTLVGACKTGGNNLDIPWTMSDPETSNANLMVTLRYRFGVTTSLIIGPTSLTSPFPWTTPTGIDGPVQILIEVADVPGETDVDTSADVEIDNTAPTVLPFFPPDQATGVATDSQVVITFSEAMARAATQAAVLISPAPTGTTSFAWSVGDTVLTITATYQASTQYTVTVGVGAMDACSPGLPLGAARSTQFTTGAGPKTPNRPANLRATQSANAISLNWDRPIAYSDGSALNLADIEYYIVFRATSATGTPQQIATPNATTYTDGSVQGGVRYWYWVKIRDTQGRESEFSLSVDLSAPVSPDGGFNLLLLLIPLIVVLLLVGIWLMRRKKPDGAAPPPGPVGAPPAAGEVGVEEPKGEAVAEESPPESQSGVDFKACPNCGTMVKPDDAECFVCGAKL